MGGRCVSALFERGHSKQQENLLLSDVTSYQLVCFKRTDTLNLLPQQPPLLREGFQQGFEAWEESLLPFSLE